MERNRRRVGPVKFFVYQFYRIIFFSSSLAFSFAGCGVESYPYLEPPSSGSITEPIYPVEERFQFGNTPDNNSTYFRGFEVYYKFYGSERSEPNLTSDQEAINSAETKEKLVSLGYERLFSVEDVTEVPLIPISGEYKKEDFFITLDFSLMGGTDKPFPLIDYLSYSYPFARYIEVDNSEEQEIAGFLPSDFSLSKSYSDFSEDVVSEEDTKEFSVALYVVTYGKYDVIYEIHSEPVYLGRIQLNASN